MTPATPPVPTHRYARVLTIAGSDSGGGAGIQADLKTFAAHGCYGMSAITALTAQNTLGVQAIHAVPPAFLKAQLQSVLDDIGADAVKIGMLHTPEVVQVVAWAIDHYRLRNVVLDPVMVATSGDRLIADDTLAVLVRELFPRCALVTPNLDEAALLLGRPLAELAGMAAADSPAQAPNPARTGAAPRLATPEDDGASIPPSPHSAPTATLTTPAAPSRGGAAIQENSGRGATPRHPPPPTALDDAAQALLALGANAALLKGGHRPGPQVVDVLALPSQPPQRDAAAGMSSMTTSTSSARATLATMSTSSATPASSTSSATPATPISSMSPTTPASPSLPTPPAQTPSVRATRAHAAANSQPGASSALASAVLQHFASPRIATANGHGTGCTLSSAIAAQLALGQPLPEAVRRARAYIIAAIEAGALVQTGHGHGPLNHGFAPQAMHRLVL